MTCRISKCARQKAYEKLREKFWIYGIHYVPLFFTEKLLLEGKTWALELIKRDFSLNVDELEALVLSEIHQECFMALITRQVQSH